MNADRYDRQLRLFGESGQKKIRECCAAIVGAGGLGSHLVQQLAFLGVSKFAVIDPDEIKETDLNRLIGSRPDDIKGGVKKVDVAKRLIHSIEPSADVAVIPKELIDEVSFSAIKIASHVFGCVDNDGARLVLNELCTAFEIPYFDLASDTDSRSGPVYGGRVFVNVDNSGCLFCHGLIDPAQASADLMSPETRKDEIAIYGVLKESLDRTGPSVVSINGIIASLAVTEFMVMIVGLRPPNRLLYYHGHRGIVNRSLDKPIPDCYYCGSVRGHRENADVDRYWKAKKRA